MKVKNKSKNILLVLFPSVKYFSGCILEKLELVLRVRDELWSFFFALQLCLWLSDKSKLQRWHPLWEGVLLSHGYHTLKPVMPREAGAQASGGWWASVGSSEGLLAFLCHASPRHGIESPSGRNFYSFSSGSSCEKDSKWDGKVR